MEKLNYGTQNKNYSSLKRDNTIEILFSTLDFKSGYQEVEMQPQYTEKTAFRIRDAIRQFYVISFGLYNAPATFERVMKVCCNTWTEKSN